MNPDSAPIGAPTGKKVLVTGASGFIGGQSLPMLMSKGYDVHAVSSQTQPAMSGVTWHQTELLEADQRKKLIETVKPDRVLHFAWIATPGIYWGSPLNENWREATIDLLRLSKLHGAKRFVGAGTCAEYDWIDGHCDEATTPLKPVTPYGKAKAACGQAVTAETGVSTAWGRIFFLYGPHEHPKRLVSSVILSLLKGEVAKCTHGRQIRDFLHVADVASAFVALLESDVAGAVNIASGKPVSLKEAVEVIARHLGGEERVEFGAIAAPASDPPRLTASVDRLMKEVKWGQEFDLEKGIEETIGWWKRYAE